jgi:cytochrome P450
MQSMFIEVLRRPDIYANLMKSIDEAAAAGKLSKNVTYQEALQLDYFQACLKEAMRLRPALGLPVERVVPEGGAEIDGIRYPGGTRLALSSWVLHRDKALFGHDADVFRPERWLEDEEKARQMERHGFWVSGFYLICY